MIGIGTDKLMTTQELAEFLRVHRTTVSDLVAAREITAIRIGRQNRFSAEAVQEYLKRRTYRAHELKG